jgi:hypothetical protein
VEVNLEIGQILSINTIDTRGRDFRVAGKSTHYCQGGPTLKDYLVKTADDPEPTKKLRWVDNPAPRGSGTPVNGYLLLLDLFDSIPFDEGLLESAKDASKPGNVFNVDDDKTGEKLEFHRASGVESLKFSEREVWDFFRKTQDEAGHTFEEFLFVEKEESNGWFTLWRGREYPSFVLETL